MKVGGGRLRQTTDRQTDSDGTAYIRQLTFGPFGGKRASRAMWMDVWRGQQTTTREQHLPNGGFAEF